MYKIGTEKKRVINTRSSTPEAAPSNASPQKLQTSVKQNVAKKKPILPWLGLSIIWILLDQITKLWVLARLEVGAVVEISSYFNLVHVLNPGAAFSFLANQEGWQRHFLSGIAVIASIIIILMMKTARGRPFSMWSLACILGGALGNLIDRLMHGAVIDFLDFYWHTYHWPAFNLADVAISIGAIGLIIDELFFNKKGNK
jgi:signal peptidase II